MTKTRQIAVIAALLAGHLVLVSLVGAPGGLAANGLPLLFLACLAWPKWIFGSTGGIAIAQFLLIAASQAVYLYATLIPLRLAGCFRVTPSRTEANPPTSPESGNPFAT